MKQEANLVARRSSLVKREGRYALRDTLHVSRFLLLASCFLLSASCFLLLASCFLLPASCSTSDELRATSGEVVAQIDGEKIYFSEIKHAAGGLNRFLKENFETSKDWRTDYIRQYIARYALTKRAEKEKLNKDKDVVFAMEQARRNILADKLLGDMLGKVQITEDEIKNYYEQNKAKYQTPANGKKPAKEKPLDEVRQQVEFDYNKKLRDEAVNRFIMDTLIEERVKMFDDVIANVKP